MGGRTEPTKANLIRLKKEAAFAREGLSILDRKREILLRELSVLSVKLGKDRELLRERLGGLSEECGRSLASLGPSYASYETIPLPHMLSISHTIRRVMGVKIPSLGVESFTPQRRHLSPALEKTVDGMAELLPLLLSYIETACAVSRLMREVAKTQKRERAIEEVHLPAYEGAITRISAALDENEREELVRYKSLKRRLSADSPI
jgi:V/A-type H+-transporting ATPase subunit D